MVVSGWAGDGWMGGWVDDGRERVWRRGRRGLKGGIPECVYYLFDSIRVQIQYMKLQVQCMKLRVKWVRLQVRARDGPSTQRFSF